MRQKNVSLPRQAKGRYLQVTFQPQKTQGCWKMKVRLVFAHFRIEVSVCFYMYVYLCTTVLVGKTVVRSVTQTAPTKIQVLPE